MKKHLPLTVTHPKLVKEWSEKNFPFLPEDETAREESLVWWKGECGHEWKARISNRANHETGCPYCTGKKVLRGFNDLASRYPELIKEWNYKKNNLQPDTVTCGSSRKVWWKCKKGHEWQTSINNRVGGNGCPICAREPVVPGINDFATLYPEVVSEWSDRNTILPSQVKVSYKKQIWWRCPVCKNEYQAQIHTRIDDLNRLCPYCSGKFRKEENRE